MMTPSERERLINGVFADLDYLHFLNFKVEYVEAKKRLIEIRKKLRVLFKEAE